MFRRKTLWILLQLAIFSVLVINTWILYLFFGKYGLTSQLYQPVEYNTDNSMSNEVQHRSVTPITESLVTRKVQHRSVMPITESLVTRKENALSPTVNLVQHRSATPVTESLVTRKENALSPTGNPALSVHTNTVVSAVTWTTYSSPKRQSETSFSPGHHTGYVIGAYFWDQQTYSTGNLLSLQCWAKRREMVVVEPFMIQSKFRAPLSTKHLAGTNETVMKLSDLYDLKHWNDYSKRLKYAPMVEWEEFLSKAPRSIILVDLKPFYRKLCSLEKLTEEYNTFLKINSFIVVRQVCLEFRMKVDHWMSIDLFNNEIFGNYTPSDVTIIFQEWSGSTVSGIADLNEIHCRPSPYHFNVIAPSLRIKEDTNAYIQKFFNQSEFVAVMLRLEWITMNSPSTIKEKVPFCLGKAMDHVVSIKNQSGAKFVFVAVDIGKYGSKSSNKLNSDFMLTEVEGFLKSIYGNSSSIGQWEKTFEVVSQTTNSGYIGYLQKLIATKAKCILLMGSGTFQKHALSIYKNLHTGHGDACYAASDTKCMITSSEGIKLN